MAKKADNLLCTLLLPVSTVFCNDFDRDFYILLAIGVDPAFVHRNLRFCGKLGLKTTVQEIYNDIFHFEMFKTFMKFLKYIKTTFKNMISVYEVSR